MAAPVPVLRLITRLNIGGPARQALLLTRELAPEFHTTLAAGVPRSDEGELADPAVPVRSVRLVRPLRPALDGRALVEVRRLLNETKATLLHTHMAKAGTIGRTAALAVRPRPRTIHTFHGHVLEGYFNRLAQRGIVEVERRLATRTDVLVAVSPEVRDALLDRGIGRPSQFHVIPLGLDLSPFLALRQPTGQLRERLGLAPEVPLVGSVGRLVAIKDHDTLLRAVARLPAVHLVIVGDGELRGRIEGDARRLGLEQRVHFTGWATDLAPVLSDLDVVVLTSRSEGTPASLIEAAACGLPVVATRVGGVPHVVQDGITGHLVAAGDDEGIAGRLGALLADPRCRQVMGEAGRRHVNERFGSARLVRQMRDLYSDLCRAPARSPTRPAGGESRLPPERLAPAGGNGGQG